MIKRLTLKDAINIFNACHDNNKRCRDCPYWDGNFHSSGCTIKSKHKVIVPDFYNTPTEYRAAYNKALILKKLDNI